MQKLNTVLLIDDDEITNFINEQLIIDMGITQEVLIAKNGQEGIDLVERRCEEGNYPELILLDLNMPVMDGFEFLEQYQHLSFPNTSEMTLVILTSSENEKDLARIKELSSVTHLGKPLTAGKIQDLLKQHYKSKNG